MTLRTLLVFILAVSAAPGRTQAEGISPELGPLSVALAAWVSEATGLPMPGSMPNIRFAEPEDMPDLMSVIARTQGAAAGAEIVAFYDASRRIIYLPAGWTGSTPGELSILVHEMVHHAQASAGSRFACAAEREQEAYGAQTRWLQLFGTDLGREFGMDRVFLLVATTCGMP